MRPTTRAAEGLDRRAFTVGEVLQMQQAGVISDEERYELIEGEIVLMQAEGPVHATLKSALGILIARALPADLWMGFEATISLDSNTFVAPDIVVFPRSVKMETLKGSDILLAIELAASSLAYDRGFKSALYAKHKLQEYWVVDAFARKTHQFSDPQRKSWRCRREVAPDEVLTFPALPGFSVRLSDY